MLTCKICGKKTPKLSWRCDEHYMCDVCGTKENLCYRNGGLTCDACHAESARKQVEAFDGKTDFEGEITCPWCGDVGMDSWEAADEGTHECGNCLNEYEHTRDVDVTYSTSKIEPNLEESET